MPPRTALEVFRAVRRQRERTRVVQGRPRRRRIERMVRVGERHPGAERLAALLAPDPFDRAVGAPGGRMPGHRQGRMPGLCRPRACTGLGRPERGRFLVAAPGAQPALVMADDRTLWRARPMHVSEHHQFRMFEPHVRAEPAAVVQFAVEAVLGRAGRREGRLGREVCLADERGRVAGPGECAGEALFTDCRIEVDAVVPDAVRERQHAGQYRGARGLADQVGRDRGLEPGAVACEPVQVRRQYFRPLESVAVAALLVGRDEQDVGSVRRGRHGAFFPSTL